MSHARRWLLWFVFTWWLWLLLAGDWNHIEWIAATAAAAVAATVAALAQQAADVDEGVPAELLRAVPGVLAAVVVDFGIVSWALAVSAWRRDRVTGVFRSHELAGTHDPAFRAWVALLATYSPNAYVVDIDEERGLALLHDLVPRRSSERPA